MKKIPQKNLNFEPVNKIAHLKITFHLFRPFFYTVKNKPSKSITNTKLEKVFFLCQTINNFTVETRK